MASAERHSGDEALVNGDGGPYWSVDDAARRLQTSPQAIEGMVESGKLQAHRHPDGLRIVPPATSGDRVVPLPRRIEPRATGPQRPMATRYDPDQLERDDQPALARWKLWLLILAALLTVGAWVDYLLAGDWIPILPEGAAPVRDAAPSLEDVETDSGNNAPAAESIPDVQATPLPAVVIPRSSSAEDATPQIPGESDQSLSPGGNGQATGEDSGAGDAPEDTPPYTFVEPDTANIAAPFRSFWDDNGGLMVFGFPLTEPFTDDRGRTVQYFERQRLETHPENRGTAYDVLLGHIGADDAHERDLLASFPFEPQPKDTTPPGDTCQFFPETGHFVCDEFLAYWEDQGLDLGDRGTSFRESLALFGYPISEVFTDPDTGYPTQYFERARFEFHADKDEDFQVLLGRLGAELTRYDSEWANEVEPD